MKKIFKARIFIFLLGGIVFSSMAAFATIKVQSSEIGYKDGTVEDALNYLYGKADNVDATAKKFCELKSGTANTVGSMYECDPGDGTKRNFYILTVNNDNSVDLIMDRNITQGTSTTTMTWNNAMKYIENNNLKTSWSNVIDVDLPKAQAIADAVGRSSWKAADSGATWWCFASKAQDSQSAPYCNTETTKAYNWLYDYTRECNGCTNSLQAGEANGYWTRDLISNTASAWRVDRHGYLRDNPVSNATLNGVRPVITVLKSNLYEAE